MAFPKQHQDSQPGKEKQMMPKPVEDKPDQKGSDKLDGKFAIITGGDSGIGRAVAIAYAKEGADVAIIYLSEHQDAEDTKRLVGNYGRRCVLVSGDVGDEQACIRMVDQAMNGRKKLDILVNNAAEQHPQDSITKITQEQLEKTFRTNIFSMFYMTKAALKYMDKGSAIINTTSVTAYRGSGHLLDYSSTKGAIVAFTRSLSQSLADRGIRVNGVAPGPVWTPLIPSTFDKEHVAKFGEDTLMKRAGQPVEVAPSFVFLASEDSSFMTGQVLHPDGGEAMNT